MREHLGIVAGQFDLRRLNFKIYAHNLLPAFFLNHARTLAQFRKADVRALAQFQTRRNQNAVNLKAGASFKFKQDIDQARVTCASAQNPAPAAEYRARDGLHSPARLIPRDRTHLQSPWNQPRLEWIAKSRSLSHARLIGRGARTFRLCGSRAISPSRGCNRARVLSPVSALRLTLHRRMLGWYTI
jgi:hypothetical protein